MGNPSCAASPPYPPPGQTTTAPRGLPRTVRGTMNGSTPELTPSGVGAAPGHRFTAPRALVMCIIIYRILRFTRPRNSTRRPGIKINSGDSGRRRQAMRG